MCVNIDKHDIVSVRLRDFS